MATYTQVGYGSQGNDVKKLQSLLNQNGYSLDEDGIFGAKTQAAVKDYQQKNNLAVDGIVGTNTWGALTKATTSQATTSSTASTKSTAQSGGYTESDAVKQAQALLQQQIASKPGAYQSTWQDQLNETIEKILNREKFSYDVNQDALYQQYADQYATQGKLAMMDTMGQLSAMTGGYGNSYAQTAGQQTYQGYLQQLNEVVPELYQLALNQYNQQGQDLLDQYSLMAGEEEQDYSRYQDNMDDWRAELERLYNQYNNEREFDYGQYSDDRAYAYQEGRDKVADEQWQKEFEEAQRQYDKSYELSSQKASGSTSSGGTSSGGTSSKGSSSSGKTSTTSTSSTGSYNNQGYSEAVVKQAQAYVGATADGKWGASSVAAAKKAGFQSLSDVVKRLQGSQKNPSTTTSSFSGSTYGEATSYLKSKGKSAAGIMTQSEWQRHRNNYLAGKQANAEGANYSSYAAYLKDIVAYLMG